MKIEIGEGTVMVWVGPGVKTCAVTMTEKPWDNYKALFSLCKDEGHKAWDCPKQKSCYRCKGTTHVAAECSYCTTCRKYGRPYGACTAGTKTTVVNRSENGTNQEDNSPIRTNANPANVPTKSTQTNKPVNNQSNKKQNPPTAPATHECVSLTDTSSDDEQMEEGDYEKVKRKKGRKRRTSSTDISSKPKKSGKMEAKPHL